MAFFKNIFRSKSESNKMKSSALTEKERLACMDIVQYLLTLQEVKDDISLKKVEQIWPSKPVNFMEVLAKLEAFSRESMALALYRAGIRDTNKAGQLIQQAFSKLSESEKKMLEENKKDTAEIGFAFYVQRLRKAEEILEGIS